MLMKSLLFYSEGGAIVSRCHYGKFRGPRDCAVRRALGLGLIIFAFGMIFSMLICWPVCQWLVILLLIGLGIFLLLQG